MGGFQRHNADLLTHQSEKVSVSASLRPLEVWQHEYQSVLRTVVTLAESQYVAGRCRQLER